MRTALFNNPKDMLSNYLVKRDEWIFIGVILAFSLIYTESDQWSEYLSFLTRYCLELSPILIYKTYQLPINTLLGKHKSSLIWLLIFVGYPASLLLIDLSFTETPLFLSSRGDILLVCLLVEVSLIFNRFFKSFEPLKLGLNKFGLDKVILIFLAGWSIYFGLLATSDMALWHERNAVSHPIKWQLVFENFPTFLSMGGQMMLLYLIGFSFYWLNRHILIKNLLLERGSLIYFFGVATSILFFYPLLTELFLLMPINGMSQPIIPSEKDNAFDWANGAVASAIMLISLPIILIINAHKKNTQLIELEKEKTNTELQLLKQQINPHFFFNTLNNLYALCIKKSEQAPEVVLQLAELMRYVVYQSQQEFVSLNDENKYIKDYTNLQSIRLHKKLTLNINLPQSSDEIKIAPLLFIILVENAFKHGIEPASTACMLDIKLKVTNEQIIFNCVNSVEDSNTRSLMSDIKIIDGLGLNNLKRRLTLLYPDRHQLLLKQHADSFEASIILKRDN